MNLEEFFGSVLEWAKNAGIKLLVSALVLFITFRIINFVAQKIEKSAEKHSADKTIMRTVAYIFKIGMKIVVVICLVGYVGIDTGGITALITSLGVGIGLAVNGALSNLAGGVLLILTRPFRIDDFIEAQGYSGTVENIHVTNTKLRTPDNKTVYIPNGALSSGSIINYSLTQTRRVDLVFSVSYAENIERARNIMLSACEEHGLVLKEPEPFVRVSEYSPSAVNITLRVWVKNADYWTVKFDILERVKAGFDSAGIKIPHEQMDVHIRND